MTEDQQTLILQTLADHLHGCLFDNPTSELDLTNLEIAIRALAELFEDLNTIKDELQATMVTLRTP